MVTDNKVLEAIILYHHVNNYLSQSLNFDGNFDWLIVYYFGQTVDNDKNLVVVVSFSVSG